MTSIRFPSYYGGSINIDLSVLDIALHSETLEKINTIKEMVQDYHFKRFQKPEH